MNVLDAVDAASLRKDIPNFRPGDELKVHVRVIEGNKSRVQVFQGLVISRRGSGVLPGRYAAVAGTIRLRGARLASGWRRVRRRGGDHDRRAVFVSSELGGTRTMGRRSAHSCPAVYLPSDGAVARASDRFGCGESRTAGRCA